MVIIPPSNFRISERDPMVLRFKWNFFGGTYAQQDLFVRILRKEIKFSLWRDSVLPWKRTRGRWTLATLRNYDGDGKENVKKALGLMSKTTTLHVHHAFFLRFLCTTTTWNDQILSLLENGKGKAINSTISVRTRAPSPLFSSNQNSLLLSNRANWDNREKV